MVKTNVLDSVSLLEHIESGLDKCEVTMDDLSTYVIFDDYNGLMQFIGKEVEYSTRKDVINGMVTEVINTVAARSIVQSVKESDEVDDEIELPSIIPDESKTIDVITFDSKALKSGDVSKSQIIMVYDCQDGKSKFSHWKDFKCLDKNSVAFNLRLFTNDNSVDEFASNCLGKYVMVDIKNTQYGLQVMDGGEMSIHEQEVQLPSEVLLSAMRLKMAIGRDPELKGYVEKYDLIEKLKTIIYFEPGYHLVEMQAEMILIDAVCRIFGTYDKKELRRMVFASRGYLLGSHTNLSNPIINYHRVITSTLKDDFKLIKMLDIMSGVEEGDSDKAIYLNIRKMVTNIMKERRSVNEESNLNSSFAKLNAEYGGLLKRGFELDQF